MCVWVCVCTRALLWSFWKSGLVPWDLSPLISGPASFHSMWSFATFTVGPMSLHKGIILSSSGGFRYSHVACQQGPTWLFPSFWVLLGICPVTLPWSINHTSVLTSWEASLITQEASLPNAAYNKSIVKRIAKTTYNLYRTLCPVLSHLGTGQLTCPSLSSIFL